MIITSRSRRNALFTKLYFQRNARELIWSLGPILAEHASFASGDYELFPDLEFSGDDYEILTYEANHGILQETTELEKENLDGFTPVELSHKPTQGLMSNKSESKEVF